MISIDRKLAQYFELEQRVKEYIVTIPEIGYSAASEGGLPYCKTTIDVVKSPDMSRMMGPANSVEYRETAYYPTGEVRYKLLEDDGELFGPVNVVKEAIYSSTPNEIGDPKFIVDEDKLEKKMELMYLIRQAVKVLTGKYDSIDILREVQNISGCRYGSAEVLMALKEIEKGI